MDITERQDGCHVLWRTVMRWWIILRKVNSRFLQVKDHKISWLSRTFHDKIMETHGQVHQVMYTIESLQSISGHSCIAVIHVVQNIVFGPHYCNCAKTSLAVLDDIVLQIHNNFFWTPEFRTGLYSECFPHEIGKCHKFKKSKKHLIVSEQCTSVLSHMSGHKLLEKSKISPKQCTYKCF